MRKRLIAVSLGALLVLTVAFAATLFWLQRTLLQPSTVGPVTIEVARGSAVSTVLGHLEDEGLLPSATAGRIYYEFKGQDRSFHWGAYRFSPGTRAVDVIETILDGRVETFSITIVEGMSNDQIHSVLFQNHVSGTDRWSEIVSSVEWISDITDQASSLEGFLFPDTYRFAIGTGADSVARHMVDRFRQVWSREVSDSNPLNALDSVTLASLVEAETSLAEERPRVAGVFLNRLNRGMLLQCDPTIVFALKQRGEWKGQLLRAHWQLDDPYNTYRYPGLPPGPINNPGRAALAAACAPESHRLLYFVAKPGGGHTFSRTLKEHNRAVARLYRSRR